MTSLAVVVCTRDRPVMLADALSSVAASERPADALVVVDSASVDPRVGEVAASAGAHVVRCDEPGLGRARNAGIAELGGSSDLVAFVDDDCLVGRAWTSALEVAFAQPSAPDFVTGRVSTDVVERRRLWLGLSLVDEPEPRVLEAGDDVRSFGHGANMAFRSTALERIGGFDSLLGVGSPLRAGEDVDAFWRVLDSGGTGYYTPDAVIVHRQWRSRREMLRSYYGYGVGAGALVWKQHRAGKLTRRAMARMLLIDEGLTPLYRSVRRGYQMAAVGDTVMLVGGVRGALRAGRLIVADGHFVESPGTAPLAPRQGPWK